ncbi:MAG: hypothetical protein LBQ73_02845, partial [Tannerellaceae bacterium]|nr:hypothetical protein [Tannerellaceae bacterium]
MNVTFLCRRYAKPLFAAGCIFTVSACCHRAGKIESMARITPVPFTEVHLTDDFWSPRIETNRTVSIPSAFYQCEI